MCFAGKCEISRKLTARFFKLTCCCVDPRPCLVLLWLKKKILKLLWFGGGVVVSDQKKRCVRRLRASTNPDQRFSYNFCFLAVEVSCIYPIIVFILFQKILSSNTRKTSRTTTRLWREKRLTSVFFCQHFFPFYSGRIFVSRLHTNQENMNTEIEVTSLDRYIFIGTDCV